jgi:hypothetical protein
MTEGSIEAGVPSSNLEIGAADSRKRHPNYRFVVPLGNRHIRDTQDTVFES